MPFRAVIWTGLMGSTLLLAGMKPGQAAEPQVMRLLATGQCPRCDLRDADLVHADLQRANLQGALLQGANLSRANLNGANLQGADLRQASLVGANLNATQLQQARLDGADLREADLAGAQISPLALRVSHLEAAINLPKGARSAAEIHNQGSADYQAGQFARAEQQFSEAISLEPGVAQSWIARSMARIKLGDNSGAKADLSYALQLSEQAGNNEGTEQIKKALAQLDQEQKPGKRGGQLNNITAAAGSLFKILAPLAMKALSSGMF